MAETHKRRYDNKPKTQTYAVPQFSNIPPIKKRPKIIERCLPEKIKLLVPESEAYTDLLAFEKKLDTTIMRKRLDIQEALKKPIKVKRKLRIFISHTCFPGTVFHDFNPNERVPPCWELRVEGKLLPQTLPDGTIINDPPMPTRKFSSFFKSLVIELDKSLYGPDNHLVEWHRTTHTQETDGFQVKRMGGISVNQITNPQTGETTMATTIEPIKCTLLLMLDHQPPQFKLDPRLGRLLAIHTQTRSSIITALWQYIKTHKLQDYHEKEFINCDTYLLQVFDCQRLKFAEIPQKLNNLLFPPDPIIINHIIKCDPEAMTPQQSLPTGGVLNNNNNTNPLTQPDKRNTSWFDVEVEIEDGIKGLMSNFMVSTSSQIEILQLDNKIQETIDAINNLKTNREFFVRFSEDPQKFLNDWLISQNRDLKIMTDTVENPESERLASYYNQPWVQEAVSRYIYNRVQQRRLELEQAMNMRN